MFHLLVFCQLKNAFLVIKYPLSVSYGNALSVKKEKQYFDTKSEFGYSERK
jgi:hypothetical protein